MANTNNAWFHQNPFGQNFGYAHRQSQFYYQSTINSATTMKPILSYSSPDDRPLNTYLGLPHVDEPMGYVSSGSTEACDVSEGSFDHEDLASSLISLNDNDLIDHALPDILDEDLRIFEFDFGSYAANQLTAVEDRIAPLTEEVVEPPPTPTLCPENVDDRVVTTKKTAQSKRKSSLKRPRRPRPRNRGNRSIHLWEFLKEMLNNSEENKSYIKWISKREGIFQLVNSSGVAKLWGQRKNRKNMTYEKMSRALRYYYEKDILERVPNARLIYKFGVDHVT
ncbi:DNA-binding D-ETS-4-like isoform X3, partial [Paramuricea clavata]